MLSCGQDFNYGILIISNLNVLLYAIFTVCNYLSQTAVFAVQMIYFMGSHIMLMLNYAFKNRPMVYCYSEAKQQWSKTNKHQFPF